MKQAMDELSADEHLEIRATDAGFLRDAEAFCWGNAVRFVNHYEWPQTWKDTVISCHNLKQSTIDSLATRAYKDGYRLVKRNNNRAS